ncbi:MAG TPA: hypothetical protein PKW52_04025, partial [Nitrospira sp.]|nr:hypothetical protein [Nitrospira sp.]
MSAGRGGSRRVESPTDFLTMAIRYLARAERSASQVEQYVQGKGASRAQGHAVVRELERRGYL